MDLVSNKIVTIIKSALKNVYNLENIDSLVMGIFQVISP